MEIFVTGIGAISAIGDNSAEIFLSLKKGKTGISYLDFLDTKFKDFPCGEIKKDYFSLANAAQISDELPLVRTPLLGLIAANEALKMATLEKKSRIAFVSGTTVGGMDRMEMFYDDFVNNDKKNFWLYPHNIGDSTDFIAENLEIKPTFTTSISTACSAGANAILYASMLIESGKFDIVIAGGAESLSKYHFNGFNSLKILSTEVCKPFDENRNGLNLGEGAGYLVLESFESIKKRQKEPLCKLIGVGNACDAFHQTATSDLGEGPYLAMTKAIRYADILPQEIDYINCHGTGTLNNDLTELRALNRVFGDKIPDFSSTKSFTGHTTSASGALEAVISVMCLKNNFLPMNLGFETPISELNFLPLTFSKEKKLNFVMSNSFGFGGNDTSLIFSKS